MSDTIVIEGDEAPPPVIVEASPSDDAAVAAGDAAAATATAVADAIARQDETDAIASLVADERAAQLERENAELKAQLAFAAGVAAGEASTPEVVEEPVVTEDDEIVAPSTHPWFRPLGEWKHDR